MRTALLAALCLLTACQAPDLRTADAPTDAPPPPGSYFESPAFEFEEAAGRIDLTGHAEHCPQIDGPGVPAITVQRIFELLEGRASQGPRRRRATPQDTGCESWLTQLASAWLFTS